jgi:hypothetical protein
MRRKRASGSWNLIFDPKEREIEFKNDALDDHSIDEKALKAIAVKATIQRRRIRDQALAADSKISGGNIKPSEISTSLAQKIVKGYHSSKK